MCNSTSTKLRLPEDGAEALKYVRVRVKCFNVYVRAFVGMSNKEVLFSRFPGGDFVDDETLGYDIEY
jgi:hypothetical protein